MGMHVPWIQVTQEAWDLANQFAGLTGLTFQEAFTGLIEAWRWGVSLGPETEPPLGICDSPRALDRLASVMRLLKMDRQALADTLVELEVIEFHQAGLRVRGTRRYWPAWAKNNPDLWKTWKAANPGEFPGTEPEPEKTRTEPGRSRYETEPGPPENRPASVPPDADADADAVKAKPPSEVCAARLPQPEAEKVLTLVGEAVPKQRKRSEAQVFWDWAEGERVRVTGLLASKEPDPARLNAWFKRALQECDVERLQAAYGHWVLKPRDDYWKARGWPFAGFMDDNVWRTYAPPKEAIG